MGLEYSITHQQSWVEVHVRGQSDYLSTDQMWKDVAAACKEINCHNILGVADIDVLSSEHAYDHAAIFEAAGMTSDYRIAWVETNQKVVSMAKLAEAVIRNRGLADGRVFENIVKAKKWLTEMPVGD